MHTILIVDDEPQVRKILKKVLERNNYTVLEAVDGRQGVDLFKTHGPDLIITDLIMPEKEGLEFIREIKAMDSNAQIIAISGGGTIDPQMYLDLARKFGAVRTFSKPIDNAILISAIKEILT